MSTKITISLDRAAELLKPQFDKTLGVDCNVIVAPKDNEHILSSDRMQELVEFCHPDGPVINEEEKEDIRRNIIVWIHRCD